MPVGGVTRTHKTNAINRYDALNGAHSIGKHLFVRPTKRANEASCKAQTGGTVSGGAERGKRRHMSIASNTNTHSSGPGPSSSGAKSQTRWHAMSEARAGLPRKFGNPKEFFANRPFAHVIDNVRDVKVFARCHRKRIGEIAVEDISQGLPGTLFV